MDFARIRSGVEIRNYNQIAWFYLLSCLIWLKQSIVIHILTFKQVNSLIIINQLLIYIIYILVNL